MIGHIKLDRKIQRWEWYQDSKMVHLFIHILLNANHKDGSIRGISIKRGQFLTGRLKLATALNLSERTVRTCLNQLKKTKEIEIKSTKKYSIITICKYEFYQSYEGSKRPTDSPTDDQQVTNKRPTSDQQVTTNNNVNNDNNVNNANKLSNSKSFPNWKEEALSFINNENYKQDFIKRKNIGLSELENRMWEFVLRLNDKMDFKNEAALKVHFGHSYAKHVENGVNGNRSLSNGFVEVPADFDYNGENVLKW